MLDERYHDTIAAEYDTVVNDPRRYANDLLFAPVLDGIDSAVSGLLTWAAAQGR